MSFSVRRPVGRSSGRALPVAAALLAVGASLVAVSSQAQARQDLPPQQPGVTLRVFDVQAELDELCTLKAGQTPNVDVLMPVIDWDSSADFGVEDRFVSETTANLHVVTAGTYAFRLTSDDGARLAIGGTTVINHDGVHPATPRTGSVDLAAGHHPLRIDHFDRLFDQRLTVEWQPPGVGGFTVVPNSALSTDADVTRVTAPGRKECEAGGDSPGDGLPLTGVHPGYTLTDLRPTGFQPQVTGMDWLPDGRLAIATWGGTYNQAGEVYLLDNVTGDTDPGRVTVRKFAQGLNEPMGVKFVDGKLYVSEKDGLTELVDTDGDWVADDHRTIATWAQGGNYHEFAFGLLYADGFFYLNLSVAIGHGGHSTNPQPVPNRGTAVKVEKATGEVTYLAGGLRTPHGIGWGPEGEILVTDNQGDWLPSSKLVQIKEGAFYNHFTNPAGPFDDQPVTQPVLWLPQNEIGNSPVNPVLLREGPFAGQLLIGDVTYGGLQRAFLEKVDGEYQGAVFRHTQGLEAGVSRLILGPDGAIYTGGIGAGGNWNQPGKLGHGLQKLSPNGSDAFDILAMRAVEGGFELEYTQPLSAETAQDLVSRYRVEQWHYEPTSAYGGPKVDHEWLRATSATLTADGRKVVLRVPGLKPGRVVHVRSPRPFASTTGETLWSTEAWYTLNSLPRATRTYQAENAQLSGGAGVASNHPGFSGTGFVDGYWNAGATTTFTVEAAGAGSHDVALRYSNGPHGGAGTKSVSVYVNGTKVRQTRLATTGEWNSWSTHTEALDLVAGTNTISYKYDQGDRGWINLDKVDVMPTERIGLFTGGDLDAWESVHGGPASWPVANGAAESIGGDIRTKQAYRDFRLHVEWWQPRFPPEVTGQARGNSGVYLQERYEVQVLDSFGLTPGPGVAGAIYGKRVPDVNAATAPETWQAYDITFRAARYDGAGTKLANARVTVVWNGQVVHDDVEVDGVTTGHGLPEGDSAGAIRLQDHGDPGENPKYRNIWIEPLD